MTGVIYGVNTVIKNPLVTGTVNLMGKGINTAVDGIQMVSDPILETKAAKKIGVGLKSIKKIYFSFLGFESFKVFCFKKLKKHCV